MARRPTPNQARIVKALVDKLEPEIANAFLAAMRAAADSIDIKALIAALDAGDIQRAVSLFRIDHGILFPLQEAVRGGYVAGGAAVSAALPTGLSGAFGFNGGHPRAQAWIAEVGARLIQGIQADTLEMARTVIVQGMQDNTGTRAIARALTGTGPQRTGGFLGPQRTGGFLGPQRTGGFLGLTTQQADSIISGRVKLASGDPALMREYLNLKLRDKRFDGLVKKAIADGKPIKGADLDRIISAHKSKALGYRGKVIAKNEAFTSQAAGRHEAYTQVLEKDGVQAVTLKWQHNLSQVPREDHVAMNGTVIKLGETFNFPDAQMRYPHDPAGGAKHSVGCRCIAVYRAILERD